MAHVQRSSSALLQKGDAEFLQNAVMAETVSGSSSSAAAAALLQASNLLNMQVTELLSEATTTTTAATATTAHRPQQQQQQRQQTWLKQAEAYRQTVSDLIRAMPPLELEQQQQKRHDGMVGDNTANSKNSGGDSVATHSPLTTATTLSSDAAVLATAANAHVLPTLTLTVLLPCCALFAPNDVRKGRYFEKRNAAVGQVALYLQKHSDQVGTVHWRYWKADPRKVCLLLVPPVQLPVAKKHIPVDARKQQQQQPDAVVGVPRAKRVRFRLQVQFEMDSIDWIPPLRLVPNRCNLGGIAGGGGGDDDDGKAAATAAIRRSMHYNHCITEDAIHHALADMRDSDDGEAPSNGNCAAAAALLQIWCLQRGLLRGHDTLDADTVHVLLLYLVRTRQVNARMTAMQVVAAVWKLLSETAWLNDDDVVDAGDGNTAINKGGGRRSVLVMPAAGKTVPQTVASCKLAQLYAVATRESPLTGAADDPPTLLELHQRLAETPVLLDSSMRHNYLFRISPACIRALQRQAAASLACLHGSAAAATTTTVGTSPFQQLFLTQARFWTRHDAYLRIPLPDVRAAAETAAVRAKRSDCADLGEYEAFARGLVRVLRRALGDRVRDLQLLTTGNGDPAKSGSSSSTSPVKDSDEIPTLALDEKKLPLLIRGKKLQSPTGSNYAVLGVTVNPDTCYRVVDRGPPHEQTAALQKFLELWGPKAELRRFKDGAIVHAVVWESTTSEEQKDDSYKQFQNDDAWQGGIVERIIRHILKLHFLKTDAAVPQFSFRDIVSTVDGVADKSAAATAMFTNPLAAHRSVMKAFESLADLLRKKSARTIPVPGSATEMKSVLGIPLAIDAIEPLSPALRYAALYPPVPHPLLGAGPVAGQGKTSGAVQSDPIEIQIRFGASSKWPTDLKAIGAAKTAMLIELVNGIETLKKSGEGGEGGEGGDAFDGPVIVTPSYADICFMGFVFRIFVRADPELKLLRSLRKPNPEAALLLQTLTRTSVVTATHHSMVHAVYTSHPSSSATVRMAKRWLSAHLLANHIPFEALELTVAHVYTNRSSPLESPGTAMSGFLRWLHLLATHDWARQPLIVDPQGHLTGDDHRAIHSQFEKLRGESYQQGPPLFVISPYCSHAHDIADSTVLGGPPNRNGGREKSWSPTFTAAQPERVVLSRAVALAARTHDFLRKSLIGSVANAWPRAFQESAESFRSYSALLRVDPAFVVNADASSSAQLKTLLVNRNKSNELESTYTRSMRSLAEGPKDLRRKLYRNLMGDVDSVLLEWRPIQETVEALRAKLGGLALVFYNDLCPDVLAVVWRPLFQARSFSAVTSEYVRPVSEEWHSDTMVTVNVGDVLREMACLTCDMVIDVKVFDRGPQIEPSARCNKRKHTDVAEEHDSDEQESDDDDARSRSDEINRL